MTDREKDAKKLVEEQASVLEALKSDLDETLAVLGEQPGDGMEDIDKVIKAIEDADVTDGVIKMSIQFRDVLVAMLKEREQDVQNLIADLGDLRKEHEKLLDKKIPLITSGQEVVRCKDCKYANRLTPHSNVYECASPNAREKIYFQFHASDWFCADGERR
jgi:hypothetical protein